MTDTLNYKLQKPEDAKKVIDGVRGFVASLQSKVHEAVTKSGKVSALVKEANQNG